MEVSSRRLAIVQHRHPPARGLLSLISLLSAFLLTGIKRNQAETGSIPSRNLCSSHAQTLPGLGDFRELNPGHPSVLFAEVVTQMGIEPMTTRFLSVALTTNLLGRASAVLKEPGARELAPWKTRISPAKRTLPWRALCSERSHWPTFGAHCRPLGRCARADCSECWGCVGRVCFAILLLLSESLRTLGCANARSRGSGPCNLYLQTRKSEPERPRHCHGERAGAVRLHATPWSTRPSPHCAAMPAPCLPATPSAAAVAAPP